MKVPERFYLFSAVTVTVAAYVLIGYFIQRHDTTPLLVSFVLLFASYVWVLASANEISSKTWTRISLLYRFVLLFSVPTLSDDVYRFLWDGRLILNGVHPFLHPPCWFMEDGNSLPGLTNELYNHLNSKENFTVYPSLIQALFALSVWVGGSSITLSIITFRTIVLLADWGSIRVISTLTKEWNLPAKTPFIYSLNPVVILEFAGNLHTEVFAVYFLLATLWAVSRSNWLAASILFGFAVTAKLLPLILLPLTLLRIPSHHRLMFLAWSGVIILTAFIPFYNIEVLAGWAGGLDLYFRKFEFNASIFNLVRAIGFFEKGYDVVQQAGPKLGIIAALWILVYSWRNRSDIGTFPGQRLAEGYMVVFTIYYVFSTTVHPWYILPVLAFSAFTGFRFPLVWSCLIFFTYAGYGNRTYTESCWVVAIEYFSMFAWMVYEIIGSRRPFTRA